jgi:hypothetical protein
MDITSADWRKSSYSGGNGGGCVEVARNLPDIIAVRDSKDRDGAVLAFTYEQWQEFAGEIKAGKLDLS